MSNQRQYFYFLIFLVVALIVLMMTLSGRNTPIRNRINNQINFYNHMAWYCKTYGMPIETSDSAQKRIIVVINIFDTIGELIIDVNPSDSNLAIRCPFPCLLIHERMPKLALILMQKNGEYNNGTFEIDTTLNLLIFRKNIDCRAINVWDSTLFYNISDAAFQLDETIPIILKEMDYTPDSDNFTYPDET